MGFQPTEPKTCCGSLGARHKKGCPESGLGSGPKSMAATVAEQQINQPVNQPINPPSNPTPKSSEIDVLREQLAELTKKDEENQKKLQMLYDVADKGRLFNWEQRQKKDKKPQKVALSIYGGKTVVGWRTVKDELIQDPRSGRTVGENQEYELLLLDDNGANSVQALSGYLNFSNARYDKRIECEVLGRSENFDGKITYEVGLPDGRRINLDSRFVN